MAAGIGKCNPKTDVEEGYQQRDLEGFIDFLSRMRRALMFTAVWMGFLAIVLGISLGPPLILAQYRTFLYSFFVVFDLLAVFSWLGIAILLFTELPMKKNAWIWVYKVMAVMSSTAFMGAVTCYIGIRLGW